MATAWTGWRRRSLTSLTSVRWNVGTTKDHINSDIQTRNTDKINLVFHIENPVMKHKRGHTGGSGIARL